MGIKEANNVIELFKGEFVTCNTQLDHQRQDLCCLEARVKKEELATEVQFQDLIFALERNNALLKRIKHLEKDAYLNGLSMSLMNLTERLIGMEGHLCHCTKDKEKGREVVKMEIDDNALVYESEEGKYHPAPTTPGPVMTKLIPIAQDLEGGKAKQEKTELCGCSLEDHPIIISDDNISVMENATLIPI